MTGRDTPTGSDRGHGHQEDFRIGGVLGNDASRVDLDATGGAARGRVSDLVLVTWAGLSSQRRVATGRQVDFRPIRRHPVAMWSAGTPF